MPRYVDPDFERRCHSDLDDMDYEARVRWLATNPFAFIDEGQAPVSSVQLPEHDRVPTVEVPVVPMADLVFGEGVGL